MKLAHPRRVGSPFPHRTADMSLPRSLLAALAALAGVTLASQALPAQQPFKVDLTVNDVGIGIGDVPKVIGIRLNFRDREDFEVRGINATIWAPEGDFVGTVDGLALGLPLTGATRISGIAAGILGVGVEEEINGIGVGGVGIGGGGNLNGAMVGGVGVGGGGELRCCLVVG